MDELVASWENEEGRRWGQALLDSIRNQHTDAGLDNPRIVFETAVAALVKLEREFTTQQSTVMAQIEQLRMEVRNKT